ncbi:MAG TPA: hypothetical protein VGP68_19905 [Gemmataceae bacterium]|jgi:hypothetical protein|nr:hypothetical protein [Gemmataceae bacterium]
MRVTLLMASIKFRYVGILASCFFAGVRLRTERLGHPPEWPE